jgi:CBS-domain-containing membrane protein
MRYSLVVFWCVVDWYGIGLVLACFWLFFGCFVFGLLCCAVMGCKVRVSQLAVCPVGGRCVAR